MLSRHDIVKLGHNTIYVVQNNQGAKLLGYALVNACGKTLAVALIFSLPSVVSAFGKGSWFKKQLLNVFDP